MKTSKEVEKLAMQLRNVSRIEGYGTSLSVAYTLDQGEKGDDDDDNDDTTLAICELCCVLNMENWVFKARSE